MNVEKVIRVLGYIIYAILWSPVIVMYLIVTPFVWLKIYKQAGYTAKDAMESWVKVLKAGLKHDKNFIDTGIW